MNIKNFTIPGFARFYHSLLRFNRDMDASYAQKLTYSLYTSVNDVYRRKKPDVNITEYSERDFGDMLQHMDNKPYKTLIQLYRAMEAVYFSLEKDADVLSIRQVSAFLDVSFMMDDIESRFYSAFNMEIDDSRTIYGICAKSLIPRRDEPGLCIAQDWLDAVSA